MAAFDEAGLSDPLDPVIYSVVIPIMRDRLLERRRKLRFLYAPDYTAFGPGRVNTFDTFKFDQFAEYYAAQGWEVGPEETFGVVDFPSVWNQNVRQGMQLHWDGNNTLVRERNFSAAIGAGTKPRDMDLPRLFRLEKWLGTLPPPPYPFAINTELARQGEAIYKQYCFDCHDIRGSRVGTVFDLSEIGTDRYRVLSYTQRTLEAQQDYTKGFDWSFSHFTNTNGYASHPLDGIWARAPYLHGGSVPTMWDLLSPADERPAAFTTGGNVYDQDKLGFVVERLTKHLDGTFRRNDGSPYAGTAFVLDTALRANGNQGHSGARYGTELSDNEKRALIEYLKYQDHPSHD